MFCLAEYIPPEKQKKGLFSKNPVTPDNIPRWIQRQKEVLKRNEHLGETLSRKQSKRLMKQLSNKMNKLKDLGVDHVLSPVDTYPEIIPEKTGLSNT